MDEPAIAKDVATAAAAGGVVAAVRSAVAIPETQKQYEPAPPGRSKKRKVAAAATAAEEMVRLGEEVERTSERLHRGHRPVKLSTEDKAPSIELDKDQRTATSTKGYKMVRATHGAHEGTWFYEVQIESLGATGAVRVGWATRAAELQAPVGADAGGYGIRSVDGSKLHLGAREAYGVPFGEGDVVGCLLHMPPGGKALEKTADDVVRYKGQLYFTEDEEPVEPAPLAGSFVQFFINGKSHGPAFLDIREGTYYPAVSLYTHTHQEIPASVSVEFATDGFKHSLPAAELAGGNMVLPVARLAELKPTQH